jgi:uncharacterized protein (TIGR03435 family)
VRTHFVLIAVVTFATLHAQSRETFDVSSVKRQQGNEGRGRGITVQPGGRFMAPAATVRELIAAAYGVQDNQIVGGPGWIASDRFQVMATTNPDVSMAAARAQLRALLADRFALAAHVEQRELAVYILSLARDDRRLGADLRQSGDQCAPPTGPRNVPMPPPPPPPPPVTGRVLELDGGGLPCPSMVFNNVASGHWAIRSWPIERLAQRLTGTLGRPVIDRTALQGAFDIDLTYGSQAPALESSAPTDIPALTTALREQLGLRLEAARAPVDVLVIDRVEAPSDN